jgi:glyoxylase-like metal-dependent hydrolase (beta-lactamase superfamily II)
MNATLRLPDGVSVFERGWLSSNNVLFVSDEGTALVDTGYVTHAPQTLDLVRYGLGSRTLDLLVNTHLHSDHCGGNAALQAAHPNVRTLVPPGLADAVRIWDEEALTYAPTGQQCERFRIDDVIRPGIDIRLGNSSWQAHAAPGHDPHSVILFEPETSTLVSADALWESGFGVVFPELEGADAFGEVAATLDVVERLQPRIVVPGHGAVFGGTDRVAGALARARERLDALARDPVRHAAHAAKVLIKFKLLEWQSIPVPGFNAWAARTRYLRLVQSRFFADEPFEGWLERLLTELERSHALARDNGNIHNI